MFPKPIRIQDRAYLDYVRTLPCLVGYDCFGEVCGHHITTVGAGGDDTPRNIAPVCVRHHDAWHRSVGKLMERHPVVRRWLEDHDRFDVLDRVDNRQFPFINHG